MDMVTVSDTDTSTAKDCTNKNVTCTGRSGKMIVDLSDQENSESAIDLNSKSPQKKRKLQLANVSLYTVPDQWLPLGYNYQPGSYTPVKPFEPPMHFDTKHLMQPMHPVVICF